MFNAYSEIPNNIHIYKISLTGYCHTPGIGNVSYYYCQFYEKPKNQNSAMPNPYIASKTFYSTLALTATLKTVLKILLAFSF